MRLAALLFIVLLLPGCAGLALAVDAVVGGVGIYQRYEDRQAQIDQTAEIKKLREELARRNAAPAPAYLCAHGRTDDGPATLCRPASTAQ